MKHLLRPARSWPRVMMLLGLPLLGALGMQAATAIGDPADSSTTNGRSTPSEVILSPATDSRARPGAPAAATRRSTGSKIATVEPAMADPAAARKKARSSTKQPRNKTYQRKQALAKQTASEQPDEFAAARDALRRARAARIQSLLAAGERAYDAGRLVAPARNNAAEAYREVLALDPNQLEALAGARRIITVLAAEAERTAAAGDRSRTQQYIAAIRALQPQDPTLLELEARQKAMTESPVVLSVRQQERYGRSAESIERAYEALQRQPLDKQAIDEALAEYDRARALVAQAPGLPMLKDRIIVAFPAATRNELAQDNSRRALKVVEVARQRGWLTPELEALETTAQSDTPGN